MACEDTWWWGFLSGAAMFTAAAIAGMITSMTKGVDEPIEPKKNAV